MLTLERSSVCSFDVTLPLECDDEFKETGPSSSPVFFRQPEETPSRITAFVHLIKLHEISSVALSFFVRLRSSLLSAVPTSRNRTEHCLRFQYAAKPPPHTISPTDMVEVLNKRLEDWKAALPMQFVPFLHT
jgi:hypothetical protein